MKCDATALTPPFEKENKTEEMTPGKDEDIVVKLRAITMAFGDATEHNAASVPLEGFEPTLEKHLFELLNEL